MRSNESDKLMLKGLEYIDDDIVSGVLGKIDEKNKAVHKTRKRSFAAWKLAPVLAACIMLLCLAIPTTTIIVDNIDLFTPVQGSNATEEINTSPKYDGSRGLIYEVNEDGESASFIGFGSCDDEVVYIASTYNGLPVTRMYNKGYWDATYIAADHGFNSKYVKRIVISDTVVSVDFECIRQCPNIESVYYGASVENIRELPFNSGYGENFSTVEVSPDNPYYSDKGNCIVDLRTKILVIATPTTVIPDDGSVEIIGTRAFGSARSITSIVIPEGVKIIDRSAFQGCMKLESVTLPDSLEYVEMNAFDFCENLKRLELGSNLKAFPLKAFHKLYCPTMYYKGTVEQWEAVIKTRVGNTSLSIPVICTDGESLSDAGKQGNGYMWIHLPEYEAYWNKMYPNVPQPQYDPEYTGE